MGRKIPGKKHTGVKNPQIQAARRFASVATKVNRPPLNPDEQEVPKKILEIMKVSNKPTQKKKKKGMKNKLMSTAHFLTKEIEQPGMSRPVKDPEIIDQLPGESIYRFMQKVNESTQRSLREAYFEDQFNVQVKRDETGKVINVVKDEQPEIDATNKTKGKKKREGALSKSDRRMAKLVAQAEVKSEQKKFRDFSDYKDEVKFGEIVHRPPDLRVASKLKLKTNFEERRPGSKDLLLKTMLEGSDKEKIPFDLMNSKTVSLDSMARKKMLEEERNRVVKLYRLMKSKNNVKL